MCMSVFPLCVCACTPSVCMAQRPEEGIVYSRTGVGGGL